MPSPYDEKQVNVFWVREEVWGNILMLEKKGIHNEKSLFSPDIYAENIQKESKN